MHGRSREERNFLFQDEIDLSNDDFEEDIAEPMLQIVLDDDVPGWVTERFQKFLGDQIHIPQT